jgi:hypothetical protein
MLNKSEEIQQLVEEERRQKEQQEKQRQLQRSKEEVSTAQDECKVCMDDNACVAFIPCGHVAVCKNCSLALKTCPICRKEVQSTLAIYKA